MYLPIIIGGSLAAGFWLACTCVALLCGEYALGLAMTGSCALSAWSAHWAWSEMKRERILARLYAPH